MPLISPRLRLRPSRKGRSAFAPKGAARDRLSDLTGFGANPGGLRARFYVPESVARPAALMVVLHGCTQDAAVYDHGAGWSTLADRQGFALLFPEQQRANNAMLCFNWFEPEDARRGAGEAASIAAMTTAMTAKHGIDPARVFVTGLSAGGAMTAAMLACYPELFAAGAIIAGVPYGCAGSVGAAFECMAGRGRSDRAALARAVRGASAHRGPWPRVQVWQGDADQTVVPANADAIAKQWTAVHDLAAKPDTIEALHGHVRRRWSGRDGETLVEQIGIAAMGHGVPLDAGAGEPVGAAGAHMLDVGLSSTEHIAAFFGIAPEPTARAETRTREAAGGPQAVIEKALRAAGLMK